MQNISRLALTAVLTLSLGGGVAILSAFVPANSAFAQQDCRLQTAPCPPSSSESSEPPRDDDPGDDPEPGNPGPRPNDPLWIPRHDPRIDCRIKPDKPITNDLWIVNNGEHILEHDTKIRWRIPSTGQHGAFLLPKDIPVGEEGVLRNFLVDTEGGAECRIEVAD